MIDKKSILGYANGSPYRKNKSIQINSPEGLIDMGNTSIPLYAEDETGYSKYLPPYSGMHQFPGKRIVERRFHNNPYQKGGNVYDFLFEDDEDDEDTKDNTYEEDEPPVTAPSTEELPQYQQSMEDDSEYQMSLMMAMQSYNDPFASRKQYQSSPHGSEIMSSGKYGNQNVGEYGRQIYGQLSEDLGYSPVANSIYRDPSQNTAVGGVKNSYHLTGNAIDLKPADWNKLTKEKQAFYRNNYDVVYHNNHYHIEPR